MSEINIKTLTQSDIKALKKRPIDQTHRSATYIVPVTWSLAAAFGVAFWLLLLSYGVPFIAKITETAKHLNTHPSPSAEAVKW